jgi:endonuclease-3
MTLPGVSSKSANLIMAKNFGKNTGVAVDTHVTRLSARMGLTKAKSQDKIEANLNALFPAKEYLNVNELMILHGRAVCTARKPLCEKCPVAHLCPKVGVTRV